MKSKLPHLLLFDYGGVLLVLNDPVATFGIGSSRADFSRRWLESPAVQAHESGRIDHVTFAKQIVRDMQLPYDWQEFIRRFDSWPGKVPAATAALVRSVPDSIECALLSNINARHWQAQDIPGDFGGRISRCFLSYEIGFVKPDPQAFRHVIDAVSIAPADILFIDDNPANIAAAGLEGMRTRLCPDVDSLAPILRDEGIVTA
jgi:glucose-1-phosphatase